MNDWIDDERLEWMHEQTGVVMQCGLNAVKEAGIQCMMVTEQRDCFPFTE